MKFILISLITLFVLPLSVAAHASPVEYTPGSSTSVSEAPNEVRIRFSERLEHGASRMSIADENGVRVSGPSFVDASNPYILVAPLEADENGAYLVSWSVVSSDDGHFTKGGYTYVVGEGTIPVAAAQSQVVQLSALPEATAIAVELAGNSLLLGALFIFLFVLRPLRQDMSETERKAAGRRVIYILFAGVVLALVGGAVHVGLKTLELASLHAIALAEAIPLYLGTVSGSATVGRMLAILAFGIVLLVSRKQIEILAPKRIIFVLCFVLLGVFAYLRAKVSHATANPFFPELSVAINFLHLIGKDAWFGLLAAVSVLSLSRTLRPYLARIVGRVFRISALLVTLVAATGTYIVWLHLKAFSNISSTLWGERFLPLMVSVVLAMVLLLYQAVAIRRMPDLFRRFLPYTLAAEVAAGALIVFFSSLMIITSPPLPSHGVTYTERSNGMEIRLERAPYDDNQVLVTFVGGTMLGEPTILLDAHDDGGASIVPEQRFAGGYVFPLALFGTSEHIVTISATQEGAYDARATFEVTRRSLAGPEDGKEHPAYGVAYTLIMVVLGSIGTLYGLFLFRCMKDEVFETERNPKPWQLGVGVLLLLLFASQLIGLGAYTLGNTYKRECIADGNAWHLMLPMRNSIPTSETPYEGCMALSGTFHLPDAREYRYLKAPGAVLVNFATDLSSVRAGVPTTLAFSLTDEEGNPATLSMVHERLVHMIIIREDMAFFRHVHPDGADKVGSDAARTATFSLPFTFPEPGTYLLALDYANGLKPESQQFRIEVGSGDAEVAATYPTQGTFDGYEVSFEQGFLVAGMPSTLLYRITKDGQDVTNLAPYLAAAMHIAVVKNDLSSFIHTHGEVHVPGAPLSTVASSSVHNHAPPPPSFGPVIEAHPIFPTPGLYTVFGEFLHDGKVIVTRFTAKVE